MSMFASPRSIIVGLLFIGLIVALIYTTIYGRRLAATEKTDLVFGNPMKALGGWHWVISGVSTILLAWLYFSWDAGRAFFPHSANELCQVAKVESSLLPMRSEFPFESRLLRGTTLVDRDGKQLRGLASRARSSEFTDSESAVIVPLVERLQGLQRTLTSADTLDPTVTAAFEDIVKRIREQAAILQSGTLDDAQKAAIQGALENQAGWGDSGQEIPVLPVTERGARFNLVAAPLDTISKDYRKIRNNSPTFLAAAESLGADIKALVGSASTPPMQDFAKQLNKMLKRIDDATVFPPSTMLGVEAALADFHKVQRSEMGSLKLIDSLALPGGGILSGNTACSEQGSGRWLPKPSDTVASFARIADPNVGYKGNPLLWYKMKPMAEMIGFLIPDFIADLVPGQYPRHGDDATIGENLKSRVLNIATGNFASPRVPVPMGHAWDSIMRVVTGLFFGILLGVPLGLFMGLSRFAKGFFDPLIELYRPVPPLAWAPLILTIFGIQDDGKIFLLFMVAFAIMVISARTGATGTQLSKIHAAHSLGASRWQVLRNVILPNSLPEILTGIRIAIGVCWGTLVAAEMLAGTTGIGFLENVARKQSDYELIWITIIILGLLGLVFDLIMRWVINRTIPWRGKG